MTIQEKIFLLKKEKIIIDIKGSISDNSKFGTIIWARSNPKEVFKFMSILNNFLTDKKFNIFIDDMCPKIIYARTEKQQQDINDRYVTFFKDNNCELFFSSQLGFKTNSFLEQLVYYLKQIKLNKYIDFLPKRKVDQFQKLKLVEFMHTFFELMLLDYTKELNIQSLMCGQFSQNIMFLERDINRDKKLNYIIIPNLNIKLIEEYISFLTSYDEMLI